MNSRKKKAVSPSSQGKKSTGQFPVVGIGASAGGLEALEQFFGSMPKNSGMAFVVIQHLDPNHIGIMPELLQRITPMKVYQASDNLKVKPNCVYVIPPNKSMSILNDALHLFDPVESRGLRLPIDVFFRSLAADKQEKSIGIILSGMGSDGSLGLKSIKERNGIVLVQDPASAKFNGMPRSATEAVVADIVAPAEELPSRLIAFLKFMPAIRQEPDLNDKIKGSLDKIIILLREQTGHDFSMYKKNTLLRRIERRKGVHQIDKIQSYVRFLQENPKEVEILFNELLIGVTSFFRDAAVWEKLKNDVFPAIFQELPDRYALRAWVPGCSTGEEAYSLAIVFQEALEKNKKNKRFSLQIFATDIDHDAIETARKGLYSTNIAVDVSPDRINRFFSVESEGFRVKTSIREMVLFATQSVIRDPPFTRLDLVTCRNLLIYMEAEIQKKMIALFNYCLNPGGILLLGTAETLGKATEGYEELDARLKIFKCTATNLPHEIIDFPTAFSSPASAATEEKISPREIENLQILADRIIVQQFAPASVLVNDNGDIIYITGRIGKFLEPVAGTANWNLLAMARGPLLQLLPGAFRKALQGFDPVSVRNVKVGTNGGSIFVDTTIQRIASPAAIRGLVIVVFNEVDALDEQGATIPQTRKQKSNKERIELENKLQRSLEDLQSTHEEMQTSQEELKSANEELQSTNEELQSTNEELTTSKEEMQSLNEELQTVNIELQSKVTDFMRASDDMNNLLNSTEIATLFLDKELKIRRYTEQATKLFKLRTADIGRPFTDQVTDLQYPEMEKDARQVMKTLVPVGSEIETRDGRWYNVRIMPYRTCDDHIDGLVITFSDISLAKKLEMELRKTNYDLGEARKAYEAKQAGLKKKPSRAG